MAALRFIAPFFGCLTVLFAFIIFLSPFFPKPLIALSGSFALFLPPSSCYRLHPLPCLRYPLHSPINLHCFALLTQPLPCEYFRVRCDFSPYLLLLSTTFPCVLTLSFCLSLSRLRFVFSSHL